MDLPKNINQAVNLAIEMTETRLVEFPNYGVYFHAKEQLEFIQNVLQGENSPTAAEKNKIDIGLMAVRELEVEEPDYAAVLIYISARFEEM